MENQVILTMTKGSKLVIERSDYGNITAYIYGQHDDKNPLCETTLFEGQSILIKKHETK